MHASHEPHSSIGHALWEGAVVLLCLSFIILYIYGMVMAHRRGKPVPFYRLFLWCTAVLIVAAALTGPVAARVHTDFTAHMLAHLLIGMAAPLLVVLAAPFTLLFRSIPTGAARRLTSILKHHVVRIGIDPTLASIMHIGGVWVLYATPLYAAMHQQLSVHIFVHVHFFLAGYVFTMSLIPIDPTAHRTSYRYRAVVLLLATAGHSILAKALYANPPSGVPLSQAEPASILMYYGGDAVTAVIIFVFCSQWFQAARPRLDRAHIRETPKNLALDSKAL